MEGGDELEMGLRILTQGWEGWSGRRPGKCDAF